MTVPRPGGPAVGRVATHNDYTFGPEDGPAVIAFKEAEIPLLREHPDATRRLLFHDVTLPTRFFWLSFWTSFPAMHEFGASPGLDAVRQGFLGKISGMHNAARWDLVLVGECGGRPPRPGLPVVQAVVHGVEALALLDAMHDVHHGWVFHEDGDVARVTAIAVLPADGDRHAQLAAFRAVAPGAAIIEGEVDLYDEG